MTAEAKTIPDDIRNAAMRAVDADREDFLLAKASDNQANIRKVAIACVEKAILAERERCAAVADRYGNFEIDTEHGEGYATAASNIAAAIRAGA